MIEIRTPTEDERQQVFEVMRLSFANRDRARAEARGKLFDLDQFLCAYDDDHLIATGAARPFRQWFGGRQLDMTGIWAVTTLPEVRGTGLARDVVGALMRRGG